MKIKQRKQSQDNNHAGMSTLYGTVMGDKRQSFCFGYCTVQGTA